MTWIEERGIGGGEEGGGEDREQGKRRGRIGWGLDVIGWGMR